MALPCPGPAPISLLDIQNEFGGTADTQIAEYYRGGVYVANTSGNANIPTSGPISFDDFFCSVAELVISIPPNTNTENLNVRTLFEATSPGSWASSAPKRLVINSGVIVGSTNTSSYALNIPSGFGGTVTIDNFGSIQGAGGAANSGTGGNAIFAGAPGISINNQGTIYAGGGGGGRGGTGGSGSFTSTNTTFLGAGGFSLFGTTCPSCNAVCVSSRGAGATCFTQSAPGCQSIIGGSGASLNCATSCSACQRVTTSTTSTAGGAGGAGGVGQGYNQSNTGGAGGSAGGTNAGTGGTGGTGGTWGTTGNTGGSGGNGNVGTGLAGSGGGLAGFYIAFNSRVTWINTGTVAGRVG